MSVWMVWALVAVFVVVIALALGLWLRAYRARLAREDEERLEAQRAEAERARADAYERALGHRAPSAEHRALELLRSALSPAQLEEFNVTRKFTVKGSLGRMYRISYGHIFNVEELRPGRRGMTWCAGPPAVPIADYMLAQKLHLETDEEGWRRVANWQAIG